MAIAFAQVYAVISKAGYPVTLKSHNGFIDLGYHPQ
jgi:hypothetical protein